MLNCISHVLSQLIAGGVKWFCVPPLERTPGSAEPVFPWIPYHRPVPLCWLCFIFFHCDQSKPQYNYMLGPVSLPSKSWHVGMVWSSPTQDLNSRFLVDICVYTTGHPFILAFLSHIASHFSLTVNTLSCFVSQVKNLFVIIDGLIHIFTADIFGLNLVIF
jgi:hypothetical protein